MSRGVGRVELAVTATLCHKVKLHLIVFLFLRAYRVHGSELLSHFVEQTRSIVLLDEMIANYEISCDYESRWELEPFDSTGDTI